MSILVVDRNLTVSLHLRDLSADLLWSELKM
jgi:hypothetical protein